MSESKAVLCYVDGPWAFFTTQPLKEQWGDDWDDAPYEHNAVDPYIWREGYSEEAPYQIIKVAFDGPLESPCANVINSHFSVKQINAGHVAWLRDCWGESAIAIPAGVTVDEFCALVEKAGGKVYRVAK